MNNYFSLSRWIMLVSILSLCGIAFPQNCPTGLVAYWKMDETSGTTLAETFAGYTATRNSVTGPISGKVDNSQRFTYTVNGSNDAYTYSEYATMPHNSAFNFPANSSFTISYWCRFTDYSYGFQDHIMISKGTWGDGGAYADGMFASGNNGAGKINFLLRDNNGYKVDLEGPNGYGNGAWHHVACVRDEATNSNILYVDGVITDQKTYNYTGSFTTTMDLQFGTLINGGTRQYFYKGDIDEVAVFNRALSSSDIATLISTANSGTGICNAPDQAPSFTSTPVTTASVGVAYSYTAKASGSPAVTYSLVTAPSGMTINSTTGLISWTPGSIGADGYVKVRANNGIPPADTQTFRIFIAEGTACPNNLMLLLKLDESSGPLYADFYNDHNATATVSPVATTGKIKGAQTFSATTKLDIPDLATEFDWASTASFSFECWIKTTTTAAMVALARNRIDYTTAAAWWIGTNSNGYAAFELRDNGSNNSVLSGSKLLNDGQWHHIMAVRDNSVDQNRLYVDGVLEATASINYPNSFIADNPTEVNVGWMHRAGSGDPEYHFLGSIDEVAIFNRAVSSSEVSSFYNSGNPTGHCAIGNYAPAITSTPVTSALEDEAYSYTMTAEDPDVTDVLILSAVTKPSWLNFSWTPGQRTAILSGTPGSSAIGNNNVTLRVSDGQVQKDQTFVINVTSTNHTPVVTSTPIASVNEDAAYSYTITVTDADAGDNIDMTAVSKPSWLTFTHAAGAKTATLTGTPLAVNIGASTVDISITDGHATIHHTYTLTVVAVNDRPVITAQVSLSTNEDVAITLQKAQFTITDEDNPLTDLTLKVLSGINYTATGTTVTPAANFNGQLTVNVVASDLSSDSQPFQAAITITAVNDPPVVNSTPVTDAYTGNLYAYIFTATDADDATLTKSVVTKPDWLLFSASTGVLTGTPALTDKGQHLVILRVSDGKAEIDQDFVITVDGPEGLNDLEAAGIRIYPVPARDYLDIQFGTLLEATQLEVISSTGSVIRKAIVPANSLTYTLDLKGMDNGTYYLHISNNTINNIGRVVIIK